MRSEGTRPSQPVSFHLHEWRAQARRRRHERERKPRCNVFEETVVTMANQCCTHTHTRTSSKVIFCHYFWKIRTAQTAPPPLHRHPTVGHASVCNRITIIMDIAQATSFNASDLHNLKVVENGSWHHSHAAAGNIMAGAFVSCGEIKRSRCH